MSGVVGEGILALRRYGFRPLLISIAIGSRLRERRRQRLLRTDYARVVVTPPSDAVLRPPVIEIPAFDELPTDLRPHAERLRREAEAVLAHRMDYLGSGPVDLGPAIDWHRDFKSGYRWPDAFYQDLEVTRLDDDSDAKVPWELSRGHQLLTLARAARLFRDDRLARELEAQLESWLDQNPAGYGINWVTSMEVAFRAINWAWAIGTLEGWRPLDRGLRARISQSLQAHARHIAFNLEGGPLLRGNHYLADVVGLLALATFLPDDPDADRWERVARRALEREVGRQVHDDGVGFEASLPYHGLSLEMFLMAWRVASSAGRPLSGAYRRRILQMIEVSRSVRHPCGRSPVIGDQDSGRLLPAGFARPATHDNLLDLGAALLDLPRLLDAPPHEEVAWTLGVDSWRALSTHRVDQREPRWAFPDGGVYILREAGIHMVVRWGGVGQNGNGGHGHNDVSSYELSYDVPVVVDSGSYVYTADIAARDAFRSARSHNLLVVDGLDLHPLPPGQPFRMPSHANVEVEEWRVADDEIVLTGSHDGFRRRGAPMRCRRKIVLDRAARSVEVTDQANGHGTHTVESFLHLSPGCDATGEGMHDVIVRYPSGVLRIVFEGAAFVTIEEGWVSSQYGARERAPVLRASTTADLPATVSYRIAAA